MRGGERTLFLVVVAVVVAVIITGLILAGSPARARRERLDARRVRDLQTLMGAVNLYWTRNKALPGSLEKVAKQPYVGVARMHDPKTATPYEYHTVGSDHYELCASFSLATERPVPGPGSDDFWAHGAGRQCFTLGVKGVKP